MPRLYNKHEGNTQASGRRSSDPPVSEGVACNHNVKLGTWEIQERLKGCSNQNRVSQLDKIHSFSGSQMSS